MDEKEKIYNELKEIKVLKEKAIFDCYSDNIFTYSYKINEEHHEFNIIADDMFFKNEKIINLLNKKRISFFEHTVYLNKEVTSRVTYNINDNKSLN